MLQRLYNLFGRPSEPVKPKVQILILHQNLPLTETELAALKEDLYGTVQRHLNQDVVPKIATKVQAS